jgi:hypothetical protein
VVTYAIADPGGRDDSGGTGVGYQVDLGALSTAAAAAMSISQDVNALAGKVGQAISVGTQGGLRIGAAIGRAEPSWTKQLTSLGGLIAGAGTNLQSCADSYDQTEGTLADSMTFQGESSN